MNGLSRAGTIVFIICALFIAGCVAESIYHPARTIRSTPADAKLIYENVSIETTDKVRISGWWVPAEYSRGTVLFCHGNAGNIGDRLDTLVIINTLGLDTFIFDYRGYGTSSGSPTENGTYLDADAAWNYLVTQRGIAPQRIIVWGRSLGGAIAARTAAHYPAGLVIIESAFTSVRDLAKDICWWLPSFILANYAYDTRRYLQGINIPVLVIHSIDDEIIPFRHGENLYDSIKGEKVFLEIRGSHNHGFIDSLAVYAPSIDDFIKEYSGGKEAILP